MDVYSGRVNTFVGKGTGLRNPRGLAFVGNVLVVTDTDKVWKISQAGQVTPLATSFPFPPALLNDAAAEKGGRAVFVTEMGPGRAVMREIPERLPLAHGQPRKPRPSPPARASTASPWTAG